MILQPATAVESCQPDFRHNSEFQLLEWSSQFPDLKPIEILRDVVERCVQNFEAPPSNLKELRDAILLICANTYPQ